ncbi:putative spermidine/putrescine transport system substrate-binding protein [Agromyces flavus]|uniref:Spermidine/putrescine transport system substrate-binding protein n=2 Tax=Agromyces flavus TaxID=589382 RepID=A0A1H1Z9K4_9MICO|nr:ABC transporter substrate-binding protein [Agromyces flavus]MCP2366986.1 putative spermidine/putrescine transport system substrate-binding protein [Agromyces flavus]GGI46628.1 spermidine/putrescine ABC transporter substrate-binding protein [Agromyces flavus]SDT30368.1 putative spermidine/putrescine transport system substrate-binding protein [Agromyces flavus]
MMRMRTAARGATVGLAIASVALLTACGTSQAGSTGGEAAEELGEMEGQLSVLAWPGYAEDGSNDPEVDWVTPFEEDTGCEVTVKTFGTSDEAVNLMKTGEYDVVSASGDASLRLVAAGDVQPVNMELTPNYENIYDFLKDKAWNTVDGENYGMPHGYGANVLMYSTDVFPEAPTSWSVVFDGSDEYAGKVTAYDSPIYIADAAMYLMEHEPDLGIENPYALDEEQLAAAVDLLKQQRENIGEYWSDYLKEIQAFTTGDTVVGTSWQVIQNVLESEGVSTAVTLPEEGATGWSDTWMIASDTESPNCAYAWLDHIASPEINAEATAYFGEAPSSDEACEYREDCEAYHAGDAEYASQIWYWTTPIEECIDGRTDVKCTDYSAWTAAWQEIKG